MTASRVRCRLLGPIEATVDGQVLDLGGPKPRLVAALLLLEPDRTISTDRLVSAVWDEDPPADPRAALQVVISNLRRALRPAGLAIEYSGGGYAARIAPDAVDAHRFVALVDEGTRISTTDPRRAATVLRDALGLWRGQPFGDLADEPALSADVSRLEQMRLRALERRIDADLAVGDHQQVLEELQWLTSEHPLREGFWGQRIVALYRSGRQADALAAYGDAASLLRDDLGLDPSPSLQDLYARVLRQDPSLDHRAGPVVTGSEEDLQLSIRGYGLVEELGAGRLGRRYRGVQPGSNVPVVVEVIDGETADTGKFVRGFEAVTEQVSRLEHPNVARLVDAWRAPGEACLVTEWTDGEPLPSLLEGTPWEPGRVAAVVLDLAAALDHAASSGVALSRPSVRDVTIVDGRAFLTGLPALAVAAACLPEGSRDARGQGSFPDGRQDVRGLGLIAFELLSGLAPSAAAAVARTHPSDGTRRSALPPLGEVRPDLPADFGEVIARSVSTDAAEAFTTAEALAEAFAAPTRTDPGRRVAPAVRNPFKGLQAFHEADVRDFFGRTELVERLHEALLLGSMAVVGPSGSGKSSLIRAGLIPRLRDTSWLVATMQPGEWPMAELERTLTEVATGAHAVGRALQDDDHGLARAVDAVLGDANGRLLLFVDQFEELYAVARREDREAFRRRLAQCLAADDERLRIVLTIRADFYDELLLDPAVGSYVADHTAAVSPLTAGQIEAAITGPARRVGVAVDPDITATMVGEVAGRPGSLPLLQFALTELFEVRDGGRLTTHGYDEIGGISGALVGRAEQIHGDLDEVGREACRQVFLRLVAVGDGASETRRRVLRSELLGIGDTDTVEAVLETFGRHRLLTFDRNRFTRMPTVEIAHEALTTQWGRLRGWIDGARHDISMHRELWAAADEWRLHDHDASYLLRGTRLEQAEEWAATSSLTLTDAERRYVDASIQAREHTLAAERRREEHEAELERQASRRLRAVTAISLVAALVAGTLSIVAFQQRERARDQRAMAEQQARIAEARALASASLAELGPDPQESIRLAIEAVETTRNVDGTVLPEAEYALHRAIGSSRLSARFVGVGGDLALSPDGRLLVTEGPEATGLIDIRDAATGESIHAFVGHDRSAGDRPPDLNQVGFGPDGTLLATGGDDGTLRIWDRVWMTGSEEPSLVVAGGGLGPVDASSLPGDRPGAVWGPSFSPDGRFVAAAWRDEGVVRVIDLDTGEVTREVEHLAYPWAARFSPDGSMLAIPFGRANRALVVDAVTGEERLWLVGDGRGIAWSPDGRHIATTSRDGTARIFLIEDGSLQATLFGHTGEVVSAAWSHDSRRLATGSDDGTARVWQLADGGAREELVLVAAVLTGVSGLSFSPDGERLYVGETGEPEATTVTVWDVTDAGTAEVATLPGATVTRTIVDHDPTRERVAVSGRRGVSIWQLGDRDAPQETRLEDSGPIFEAGDIQISPDGSLTAVASGPRLGLWETETGRSVASVNHRHDIWAMAWSRDTEVVATGTSGGEVRVTHRSGDAVAALDTDDRPEPWSIDGVAFSPDGEVVAVVGGVDGTEGQARRAQVELWDWQAGERTAVAELATRRMGSVDIAFHPSGDRFAVGGFGSAEIVDVATGDRISELVAPGGGPAWAVAWAADGARLAAGHDDGRIRLWDPDSGREVLELRGHDAAIGSLAFSSDRSRLVSADTDGQVRVWALGIDELLTIARDELVPEPSG